MGKLQDALLRLAVAKAIADQAAKATEDAKAVVKAEVGGRMGATGATLPDGTEGATVSISSPRKVKGDPGGTPYVSNPAVFTEWVETFRPSAIVKSVRSTDVPSILTDALAEGELPPGCSLTDPTPPSVSGGGSVIVRQTPEQLANLVRVWRDGQLPIAVELPEIEEPDDDGS